MPDISAKHNAPLFPFQPGKTIGRYELLHQLASGGMAAVFLGRFSGMAGFEKLLAIKVIHPHLAKQREFVEMFLDEARLSAKIHHPNVVEIFEVGEEEGLYYMVAELVRGRSLRDLLQVAKRVGKPPGTRLFLTIIAKVCDALHAAHTLRAADGSSLGLVHRDASPSNILISYDGIVKLIDFGIAFATGRITKTRAGIVKGKLGYLAPEQWRGDPVDKRIDIYCLGVVLYLVATGKHPFPEVKQSDDILKTVPPPPREINPEIDPGLAAIIDKALAKDPNHRHQTAEELGREIRKLLVPLGGAFESVDIANLMADLFTEEIVEDRSVFEHTMAMTAPLAQEPPGPEDEAGKPSSPGGLKDMGNGSGQEATAQSSQTLRVARETEVIHQPLAHKARRWKGMVVVLCALAATVALAYTAFLASEPPNLESPPASERPGRGLDFIAGEPLKAGKASSRPDTEPTADRRRALRTPVPDLMRVAVTTEIHLLGLPENAQVQLNGKDTAVIEGKIAMPADGKPRELTVFAAGYEPYSQQIDPKKTSEFRVLLQKKGTHPRTKVIL